MIKSSAPNLRLVSGSVVESEPIVAGTGDEPPPVCRRHGAPPPDEVALYAALDELADLFAGLGQQVSGANSQRHGDALHPIDGEAAFPELKTG
jgi:hypothetical protein